jgi:hypothetical protein
MANKSELLTTVTETSKPETTLQHSECGPSLAAEIRCEPLTTGLTNDPTPKQSSQKKIEANRRNAQLSPGPRTPAGKKTSSRNATTHALLVQNVLINTGPGKENQVEFEALLAGLRDDYQPVGIAEDLLVRELAISYWRTARALRCERGAVRQSHTISQEYPELNELQEMILKMKDGISARHSLLTSSRGLNYLLRKVEDLKAQVKVSPSMPVESFRLLSPDKNWGSFSSQKSLLVALENETEELIKVKAQIEQEDADQKQAGLESSAIPSIESSHRIQRYETSNVRHRYRVEQRLEDLQFRRRTKEKPVSEDGRRPN